jgi:membrane-bound inhibitor of C-type lysozyme
VDTGSRQENASKPEPVGEIMNKRKTASFGAALFLGMVASSAAPAQTTFKNYQCADGTQFIVGFFQYDSRAHLQLDGKPVTLAKRLALSGSRYTGSGVTLKITKAGLTTLKHAKRPVTACEQT